MAKAYQPGENNESLESEQRWRHQRAAGENGEIKSVANS
jgi:hypothetical protein